MWCSPPAQCVVVLGEGSSIVALSCSCCLLTAFISTGAAAQTAYLVGVSDPNSTAATPGIVDPELYIEANKAIAEAVERLSQPGINQQEVLAAATQIAQYTSKLCNACKSASQKCDNPVAKRHFVQCAKDVANSTAQLVKCIKALATKLTPGNTNCCLSCTDF